MQHTLSTTLSWFKKDEAGYNRLAAADIDSLKSFLFLHSEQELSELKSELPQYLAAAEDVPPTSLLVEVTQR